MTKMRKLPQCMLFAMLLTSLLSACNSFDLKGYLTTGPGSFSALDYFDWLADAEADAIRAEQHRLLSKAESGLTMIERTQLAMIYGSYETAPLAIRARALELLQDTQEAEESLNQREYSYRVFSRLWSKILEQEQDISQIKNQNEALQEALTASNARNQDLEGQIQALTNIEEQLIQREQLQESNE